MSRRLRDQHQDEMAQAIIARSAQRRANAEEWLRRAGEAERAGFYMQAHDLRAQADKEWP